MCIKKSKLAIMKVSSNKDYDYTGEKFRATRPLDYIYDPLFTFAGPKDYYRTAHESLQSSSEFTVQPIFESMFSDMVRYPRANLVVRPAHQLPRAIDSSYKGKIKATQQERTVTSEVTGVDRYKYFRRPVTETQPGPPTGTVSRALVGLDSVTNLGIMAPPTTAQVMHSRSGRLTSSMVARGVQTDYRESEVQTRPWTPPFVANPRSRTPEVLRLQQLTWGDGLPPGKHEVDIVERLRMKQAWEAQLPPLDTKANIRKRFKFIADMEKSDWNFRDKEIQTIHEERMKKSEKLLEQHAKLNRARLSCRMEFLEDDINRRKERKLEMSRHDKERALRKLCMKEKGYNPKHQKMGILGEHLHHTSELYAPMKRMGKSFRNRHEVLAEKHIVINRQDISSLENEKDLRPVFDFNKASQPKKQTELCVRETRWTMENLAKLHQDLLSLHAKEQKKGYMLFLEPLPKPPKLREVPSVPLTVDSTENLYQAAILIQRIIHGRAVQLQMHEGRVRWKEMMEELRAIDAMSEKQLDAINNSKGQTILDARLTGVVKNIVGQTVGLTVGQTLALLAQELLRFRYEGVAHSQALRAESARIGREAPEAGRRQRELRRRIEHATMFTQLLDMYQQSINEFIGVLVSRAREHVAKTEAYDYAKEVARLAALQVPEVEEPDTEPVSAELLFAFIAPEGLRELARTCLLVLKRKYDEAREQLVATGRAKPPLVEATIDNVSISTTNLSTTAPYCARSSSFNSFTYSDVEDMVDASSQTRGSDSGESYVSPPPSLQLIAQSMPPPPPVARFGLISHPSSTEERLLARVMRDMCYIAGSLLHTAAKILNRALYLSGVPQESFEEALRRTMLVINEAREEIVKLIFPNENLLPSKIASEELILEASRIVDGIIEKAKERIAEFKDKQLQTLGEMMDHIVGSDITAEAEILVDEVVDEAQRKVLQSVVENFLQNMFKEAKDRVDLVTGDWYKSNH